jgi:undecaprenyl-diphosphatase
LLVAQHLMGIGTADATQKAAADAFAICIQGGAILAVTGLYWKHVLQMIRGVLGQDKEGLKLAMNILVGFLPAAVIGLLFNDWIEQQLFGMWPIITAWVVGGVLILIFSARARQQKLEGKDKKGTELIHMTWKMALLIGLLQCVAMWPGTSRSLMTILGGVLVGLRLSAAVEFSFLLGVLTLTAATAKKAVWPIEGIGETYDTAFGGALLMWESYGFLPLLVGVVAATVSAAIAVKWMVAYLNRRGLGVFGWYRIVVGIGVGALILTDFHGFGSV